MLLRRASPNDLWAATNAAVLNHSAMEGFGRLTDWPGTDVGPHRSVGAWLTSQFVAQNARSEGQARSDGPVAAPLPVAEDGPQRAVAREPALVVAEGQFPQVVAVKLCRWSKLDKPALRRQVECILGDVGGAGKRRASRALRHQRLTASDRGRIVDRLRKV